MWFVDEYGQVYNFKHGLLEYQYQCFVEPFCRVRGFAHYGVAIFGSFLPHLHTACSTTTMPTSSLPPPAKRRRTKSNETVIKDLEFQITIAVTNNASLNPLSDLLDIAQNVPDARDTSKAVYSLYRVFVVIISSDKLAPGGGDAAKVVRKWVWERLDAYVNFLLGLLQDEEATLRVR